MGAVVVHFHRERDVARVVADVIGQGVSPEAVVVVDNGSDAPLLERELAARGVSPRILRLENVGFGAAANAGERLLGEQLDTFVVLSHEVELTEGVLPRLWRTLTGTEGAALVGPLLLDVSRPGHLWSAGGWTLPAVGVPVHHLHGALVSEAPQVVADCDWLDGAVLVADRKAWQEICGFDERFWLSHEDVDLGWRVRARGRRVLLDPTARVGQSPGGHLDRERATRNMIVLQRAHGNRVALLAWLVWSLAVALGRAMAGRNPRPVWRGIRRGLTCPI